MLAATGVPALPEAMRAPPLERWFPDFVLVVEGAARAIAAAHAAGSRGSERPGAARPSGPDGPGGAARPSGPGGAPGPPGGPGRLRVVAAPGSGDDTIAELARELPGRRLVVTADRQLRDRCTAAGASVTGPGWLLGQL